MNILLQVAILLLEIIFLQGYEVSKPPHIIFIYADDFGMNDFSLRGSPQIPTPNMDALALNGLFLDNYYGEWLCLQHFVLRLGEASGLPLGEVILPQHLKKLGYQSHIVGKWHLGYQTKEYTPTYRGFDSHLGYLSGFIDYYDHTIFTGTLLPNKPHYFGLDFHNGTEILRDQQGKYATHLFTETAEQIIRHHDTSKVWSVMGEIRDADQELSLLNLISIISVMDDSIGSVFKALHQKDMLRNSIVLFVSDNGAEVNPKLGGYGSNYPLRGVQGHPVGRRYSSASNRLESFAESKETKDFTTTNACNGLAPNLLQSCRLVSSWKHICFPSGFGGDPQDLGPIDGVDMWEALLEDSPSPRTNMLQNLDPIDGTSAFRLIDLKVVNGSAPNGFNSWYGPSGLEGFKGPATFEWVFKNGSVVGQVLKKMGMWIAENPRDTYERLRIKCQKPPPENAYTGCQADKNPCLFNITADPCEYKNIADEHPE
ncbi:unnamed protein product, partial [Larinioides sclopetarius]